MFKKITSLYDQLASIYEAMYQSFIDYDDEFQVYSNIIKQYNFKQVIEIGSGTGHLAKRFQTEGFDYLGLDYSNAMIRIAKEKHPQIKFVQGDMRDFKLKQPVESIIITARTISYLVNNQDINAAFKSIHHHLKKEGVLCFDFIDANRFIPAIDKDKAVLHKAIYEGIQYVRESFWSLNLQEGWTFDWRSEFYKIKGNTPSKIGTDTSTVRTFTQDEIRLFLALNDFELIEMVNRPTYAFDTFLVTARKL